MCCSWENRNTWVVLTYVWHHVNRTEPGPRAGPHRPCLRRKSRAVTLQPSPCQASSQTESQLPLLGTARGDAVAAPAASQHPGSKGAGQGPEKSKLCLPAQAQGQTRARRGGKHRHIPLGGDRQLSWLPGLDCTTRRRTSWEPRGAWAESWEPGSCYHSLVPQWTHLGTALGPGTARLQIAGAQHCSLEQGSHHTQHYTHLFYLVRAPRGRALHPASQPVAASHLRGDRQRSDPSSAVPDD